ncbi:MULTISPECIES: GNAT family N-acetyltransferase [Streptomyces]|uniref:Acetyltransferase n=2 Tax=Streptomyces TaxID=1883 RepID=A0A117IXS7_9ACTN|nr:MULTISPECIES: GNAT family N-acetyltransferase [Streptomyces]KUH40728.1 acetyltransferase [Streptomyces kanasensis]UUS29422.1 GNAT family N-acetyltransferase [Streptomyces changanensis]
MRLRDVSPDDVDVYVRMRCDPVMMAGLGGPLPREGIADKVRRDIEQASADLAWIKMIVPDPATPEKVAGTVTLWSHDAGDAEGDGPVSEIGWMVLPEFQRQGWGKRAVRALLEQARDQNRWGVVHAFPATTNAASNGICRSVGFRFLSEVDMTFAGRAFKANHWTVDPRTDLA